MRFAGLTIGVALAVSVFSCTSSREVVQKQPQAHTGSPSGEVLQLIADVPAEGQAENEWLYRKITALGPSGIHALADMLTAAGSGDDSRARYGMNGVVKYVSGAGRETERGMVERMLIEELKEDNHASVNIFLMEQLELIGSSGSVPALQSFIGDDRLHEPAVHALRAINTPEARGALVEALSGTQQGEKRAAAIKALGDLQVTSAVQDLLSYASSDDVQTRKAALYALAQSGSPEAEEALVSALESSGDYQNIGIDAERYYLLYARRLAEEGNTEQSATIGRDILSGSSSPDVRSSALSLLVANEGEAAYDALVAAAESSDGWLRSAALNLFEQHDGWAMPERWTSGSGELEPAVQSDIIAMLGRSGRGSVSTLRPFMESDELAVRIAAARAVALLDGEENEALPVLLDALKKAEQPREIAALKKALLQLPTQPLVSEASGNLSSASGPVRIALVEILAERRATQHLDAVLNQLDASDEPVRLAIFQSLDRIAEPGDLPRLTGVMADIQNENERAALGASLVNLSNAIPAPGDRAGAVLEALDAAPDSEKPHLLALLPEIGGEKALDAVADASGSANEAVQQAAFTALSSWEDASAIPPLLEAFQDAPASGSGRAKLLAGYTRLVQQSKYSAGDKVRFLKNILNEASSADEEVAVMKAFAGLESPEALQAVASHFDDEEEAVKEESLRSAAKILSASNVSAEQELSLVAATNDSGNKEKIERYMQQLESGSGEETHYTSLFNGEDLDGWVGDKDSYAVSNGQIISKEGAAGNLFTEQEFSNFSLKFEFKLTPGANNGLGIRSPLEGNPAYDAMELQIIDNTAEQYAELEPYQFHGSVYGVAPAERGHLNPVGEWNTQEVIADGSQITVKVNGQTILTTDIGEAAAPETIDGRDHPGLERTTGHIGFLGHGDEVAFRNIRIQDLDVYYPDYSSGSGNGNGMNQPPEGFTALFNGEDLAGWNGLVGDPVSRAEMSKEELAQKQEEANADMRRHWSVRDGVLTFDGEGHSLVTEKNYGDFEMMVDWKIEPGGDSGIYLRGTPQVQIWDITEWPQGSGGLYNNQNHPSEPLAVADNAVGEWNSMRIRMTGENVTVHLNDELVVDDVILENYWDRDQPIYPAGQIELQSHSTPLYFKNIFIREIPRKESLFNGEDLTGWQLEGDDPGEWHAGDGLLYTEGGGGWLSTAETYDNFRLELEYRLPEGGNSGVFLRAPREGNPAYEGLEIQLLDDDAQQYADLDPWQYTGSIYNVQAPSGDAGKKAGEWQKMVIVADGPGLKVRLNGEIIINANLVNYMDRVDEHPGLKRRSGHIGLQNHGSRVEFRNITITEIK